MDDNDHDHIAELLDRYRTGELDEPDRLRVEGHLEGCAACRRELEAVGAFARLVERGYAAERAARAAEREPDWARLRASIVERTSARASGARRARIGRYVPQAALAVLALVALGVLWEQGVRSPGEADRVLRSERPGETSADGAEEGTGGPVATTGTDRDEDVARGDRFAETGVREAQERTNGAPPAVLQDEPEGRRRGADLQDAEFRRRVDAPELDADEAGEEAPDDRAGNLAEAVAPAEQAEYETGAEARPDAARPAAQARDAIGKAAAALPPDLERFQRSARSALSEADTLLAARALAQWRDSLAPGRDLTPELERAAQALADSLAAFLATRP